MQSENLKMGPKRAAAVQDEVVVALESTLDAEKEVKQTKKAKTGKAMAVV